ncbi:uncharacterized protein DUF58 [Natranaerovirga pectinivora]|uniref:Uncharacterized protein DUF58 n=1 Tax=Natranaerovirga pectinivora TaxID=682400 RepID=A0A4R3MNI1_9FIRM|nr:DUF58 domain-containing protein [Natranaerovirga pectinivora]TCT16062.1 uncharacterized protein DUF58 [Natranaerovirga pectinivora]
MKRNRVLYISLLILAFVFVYFHGGRIPYMLFYTVIALPIVSFVHIFTGYFVFKYNQNIDTSTIVKGAKVTLSLCIVNRGLFILPYVKIRFYNGGGALIPEPSIKNLFIHPFSKRELCFEHRFKYRGAFDVGVSDIEIQDFLGIFKFVRRNKRPLKVTVLPRVVDIDSIGINIQDLPDQISNSGNFYEDVSVIDEINKYNYGDSLRKVHWKLTAKVNELMVKKYESTFGANAIFIVDLTRVVSDPAKNAFIEDKHIEAVVSALRCTLKNGANVRFIYYDGAFLSYDCNNLVDFENIYQAFGKVTFNQEISYKDIIYSQVNNSGSKPDIFLSTSIVDQDLYETICRIMSSGYHISLIYVSPEKITGEKKLGVEQILSELSGAGIKVYNINIGDNLKDIFNDRGE